MAQLDIVCSFKSLEGIEDLTGTSSLCFLVLFPRLTQLLLGLETEENLFNIYYLLFAIRGSPLSLL